MPHGGKQSCLGERGAFHGPRGKTRGRKGGRVSKGHKEKGKERGGERGEGRARERRERGRGIKDSPQPQAKRLYGGI